jgi:hypothetical protein
MAECEPGPESHWYSSHVEDQPPHEKVLSLQALVQEARGRLGPGATREAVLADLRSRDLDVSLADVARVWDEIC